jgi:hypothetical protein
MASASKRELVVQSSQSKLEQRCGLIQVSGAIGPLTRDKDLWTVGHIAKPSGQTHHLGVIDGSTNGGRTRGDPILIIIVPPRWSHTWLVSQACAVAWLQLLTVQSTWVQRASPTARAPTTLML